MSTVTDKITEEQLEELRAKRREAQRRWRAKNKDKVAEYARRKRAKNPEKYKQKYTERYWKHREELKAKARARYQAKHPGMKPLTPMNTKPTPHKPHPKKYKEFDRDKLAMSYLNADEKKQLKALKNKLVALDRLWNIKRIDLEQYIRERSLLLTKIQKFDKLYRSDE